MNITTILLAILGLVLVTTIVLSATALASVLILGALHWKWVLLPVEGGIEYSVN